MTYSVQFEISDKEIEELIKFLNEYECDINPIDMSEIKSNQKLRNYILQNWILSGRSDMMECWNMDGWIDIDQFR